MGRKIGAFLAFNIYSLFLLSAFQENTPYLFDLKIVSELKSYGIPIDLKDWGWGGHYIWRLFSGCVVTVIVGFLSGAIAKNNGGKIAAISNIPSILIWGGIFYLLVFAGVQVEAQIGFAIISIIAIPLTTYIAYVSGHFGEQVQNESFGENTVLGIRPYHLIWGVVPLYWYGLGIVFVGVKFIAMEVGAWSDASIFGAIISLLGLIPVIVWIYPLVRVHKVLSGKMLAGKGGFTKAIASTGILVGGGIIATAVQFACFWLLSKIIS